jgi:hypothetical protein
LLSDTFFVKPVTVVNPAALIVRALQELPGLELRSEELTAPYPVVKVSDELLLLPFAVEVAVVLKLSAPPVS